MHYYRPLTPVQPVKPYHNLLVKVPSDFFTVACAHEFFKTCKNVSYNGGFVWSILTIKTPSEVQSEIIGASVESI